MIFGLSDAVVASLRQVFAEFPAIDRVLIFGSRAKGHFKDGSDIDLAVLAPGLSDADFTVLWSRLDDLPLVFKLDVLHWDRLGNERLKAKVLGEGRVLFESRQSTE
ncbi:MAG: DNA polymerase III subunit beta [Alphaproteobacteria bacterium CG_4_10_14_0_2_um_filter_63_37]|nr:MAG: DNA polymerase III subunit beta [Alphaproteobacteria bacterium CG_4_10_14_0_2_um_filter_63_37]